VTAWLYVLLGVTCILAVCFGVHSLISLSSVSFPASVACMIGLFLILVLFQGTLGDRKTKQIVNLIEIPVSLLSRFLSFLNISNSYQCGFALRYINIFFCPAFVTLPLSPSISGVEVAKIIAVFSQRPLSHSVQFLLTSYSHWICCGFCFHSIYGSRSSASSRHIQACHDRTG
jgi:hypothetical protein